MASLAVASFDALPGSRASLPEPASRPASTRWGFCRVEQHGTPPAANLVAGGGVCRLPTRPPPPQWAWATTDLPRSGSGGAPRALVPGGIPNPTHPCGDRPRKTGRRVYGGCDTTRALTCFGGRHAATTEGAMLRTLVALTCDC